MVQQNIFAFALLPALVLCAPRHRSFHNFPTGHATPTAANHSFAGVAKPTILPPHFNSTNETAPTSGFAYPTGSASITKLTIRNASPTDAPSSKGQVYLRNNCNYAVTVKPFPGSGCTAGDGGEVAAGSSWTDSLSACSSGNTALKVYKDGQSSPMQFEYGVDSQNVWYDMSFIDCLQSGDDFSQCAGAGWSMGSESNCHQYKCTGGTECCKQGYCDPYATGVDPAPNTGCGSDQGYTDSSSMGIYIDLCVS